MADPLRLALVVEDELSLALLERVVQRCERFEIARRLIERGVTKIAKSTLKYRQASHVLPHVVLVDLDRNQCPSALRQSLGVFDIAEPMLFRVAVREAESWVLGDREGFATFASVPLNKMPLEPERLDDPKAALISMVRRCRNRRLAAELVPPHGSTVSIGPLYNERLTTFVRNHWDIDAATQRCPSLARTRRRLAAFLTEP